MRRTRFLVDGLDTLVFKYNLQDYLLELISKDGKTVTFKCKKCGSVFEKYLPKFRPENFIRDCCSGLIEDSRVISRKEAIKNKLNLYFTGFTCSRGHLDYRYTANKTCISCFRESYRKSEEEKALLRERRLKEKLERESSEEWLSEKRAKKLHWQNLRSERTRRATPVWVDKTKILEIYKSAKVLENKLKSIAVCDDPFELRIEVDHDIPLKNDLVCGLHCEENLKLISKRENMKKGNIFSVEDF